MTDPISSKSTPPSAQSSVPSRRAQDEVNADLPDEWLSVLLDQAAAEEGLDIPREVVLVLSRPESYVRLARAGYRLGYAAALGYEISVSESGDRLEVGDRAQTVDEPHEASKDGLRPPPGWAYLAAVGQLQRHLDDLLAHGPQLILRRSDTEELARRSAQVDQERAKLTPAGISGIGPLDRDWELILARAIRRAVAGDASR